MSLLLLFRSGGTGTTTGPTPLSSSDWTGLVRLRGTATIGSTLTIDTTNLPVGVTYSYQWVRASPPVGTAAPAWSSIGGATGASYVLTAADVGKIVSVVLSES